MPKKKEKKEIPSNRQQQHKQKGKNTTVHCAICQTKRMARAQDHTFTGCNTHYNINDWNLITYQNMTAFNQTPHFINTGFSRFASRDNSPLLILISLGSLALFCKEIMSKVGNTALVSFCRPCSELPILFCLQKIKCRMSSVQ